MSHSRTPVGLHFLVLILCSFFLSNETIGQSIPETVSTRIDSMEQMIETASDSTRYRLLEKIYVEYSRVDRSYTQPVLKQLLSTAYRLKDNKKIGKTYHNIGADFLFKGQNDSARVYAHKAYEVIKGEDAQLLTTDILNNIALIHQRDNEYEKAIETYQKTITIADSINALVVSAYAKANLMTLLMDLNDEPKALEYADEILSLEIDEVNISESKKNEIRSLYTAIYLNAGICYNDLNQLDSAEAYFTKAQDALQYQSNDYAKSYYQGYISTNLGDVYISKGEAQDTQVVKNKLIQKANEYFKESYDLFVSLKDERGVTMSLVNQGKAQYYLKNHRKANQLLKHGLALAKSLNYKENIRDALEYLAKNEEALKRYRSANEHLRNFILQRDSIRNEERDKITRGLEIKFETAKKDNAIKQLELQQAIASREQAVQRSIFLISLLGLIGLAYMLYSRMRYRKQKELTDYQQVMNDAMFKFVPMGFLKALGKDEITKVSLGDKIESEVTVVFTDIRSFTIISEGMTPSENFDFVKEYAARMGPIIERHGGFISQYLGDGLMAIFRGNAEDALIACIEMQEDIKSYNQIIEARDRKPITVGMGLHTGPLIMGIIGDEKRYDATLISDTVNTAAGLEMTTKKFGSPILLSEETLNNIDDSSKYNLKPRGELAIKGKSKTIKIFECDPDDLCLNH